MLKIGVLGAGHLGRIHLMQIKEIELYELAGFYDPDPEKVRLVKEEFGIKAFDSIEHLVSEVDVVDIVTPTLSHFNCANVALEQGRHIFIEKPLTYTLEEADELVKAVREKKVKAQVGHVERFNPAFLAAKELDLAPMFIECTRIAQYNPRGTDVSVVLDLMIHDIDLILNLIKSEVESVHASGVPIISDSPDIANARIEFKNGYVANITTSRASLKNERKMRLFQKNAYITLNFLDKKVHVYRINDLDEKQQNPFAVIVDAGKDKAKKEITFDSPKVPEINAIREELRLFAESILNDTEPVVTIEDGFRSLKLAYQILDKINSSLEKLKI